MAAAVAVAQLRSAQPPGRSRRSHTLQELAAEPLPKRRKFTPRPSSRGESEAKDVQDEDAQDGDYGEEADEVVVAAQRSRSRRSQRKNGERIRSADATEPQTTTRSARRTRPRRERPDRYAPPPSTPRPRYSSAAAAAAATQASDGYKPREERSWEEFHPDLDIDAALRVFTADEVDGRTTRKETAYLTNGSLAENNGSDSVTKFGDDSSSTPNGISTSALSPLRRRPGRPPRRPETMLNGLGSPPAPRIAPLPTHNPKEKLNLPKPSFRHYNHCLQYEEDQRENKVNYVDRTMASVGYQETDRHELPRSALVRWTESSQIEDDTEVSLRLESDGPADVQLAGAVVGKVEYDMDEQDVNWLEDLNATRKAEGVDAIKPAIFEITMTQIEKEYHALEKRIPKPQPRHAQMHRPRSSSQAAVNGDPGPPGAEEPDTKCAVCDDGDCENANAIIFCDGCDLAVHQECYGVPFIPEGQWFCRRCKEVGRGTPTCIFCPNVDGAFKQTNTLRWSHLLCAIFIPEVSVSNMTFMEPITDVERVPKSRWKLHCYICNQKMGACIQCGNKNCYQAFHVSCARKAKLFLRMKSPYQQGLDTTALKAFCDKHVPPEWRRTHDTDTAIVEAKRWYRHTMKDRRWADSQTAAMEMGALPLAEDGVVAENNTDDINALSNRRRVNQTPKTSWRLPSGAPVVPAVVYNTVEASLARFTIRKRKEFVERACRYWTLKREARRGAALLKRLQLQLESFSSMEITRRNFAGMGAAGRPRLLRRIEFAELLQRDITQLATLCSLVREREELRLKEVELLRELVDTVYFPVSALLTPILQRARKLDEKTNIFKDGFERIELQLRERYYTSVQGFSQDLCAILVKPLAIGEVEAVSDVDNGGSANIDTIHYRLNEAKPGTTEHMALTQEQKDLKRLVKRIVKAVKEPLEDALKRETELRGLQLQEEMAKLNQMSLFGNKHLQPDDDTYKIGEHRRTASAISAAAGALPEDAKTALSREVNGTKSEDVEMADADDNMDDVIVHTKLDNKAHTIPISNKEVTPVSKAASDASSMHDLAKDLATQTKRIPPPSPPTSTEDIGASMIARTDPEDVFAHGGVPWYLEPFDPIGTTIHDERYTGREVLRDMSEELSDMDEDTLTELAGAGIENMLHENVGLASSNPPLQSSIAHGGPRTEPNKKQPKKKGKRAQWSRRRR